MCSDERLISVCQSYLAGELDCIELSQAVVKLRFESQIDANSELFVPFRAIDSDTDHLPQKHARQHWSESGLREADEERQEMQRHYDSLATEACRELLRAVVA